jgi:pSer/pThr/pTyr-binding forkhead associated (FHA) protein
VAAVHARIIASEGRYWLEGAGTGAGVSVNGVAVTRAPLRHLDVITVGEDTELVFLSREAHADVPPAAPKRDAATANPPAARVQDDPQPEQGLTDWETRVMGLTDLVAVVVPPLQRDTGFGAPGPDGPRTMVANATIVMVPVFESGSTTKGAEVATSGPRTVVAPAGQLAVPTGVGAPIDAQETVLVEAPGIRRVRLTGPSGVFTVGRGRLTVGREADANIRLDSRDVSRAHAEIVVSADGATIQDLGSSNGTTLNGVPARNPSRMATGDRVAFGALEFNVELLSEGD